MMPKLFFLAKTGTAAALNKAEVNRHWYVFRTRVGAPTGTAILIEPFRSLREVDPRQLWFKW